MAILGSDSNYLFQFFGSGFFPDPDQTFFPESGSGSAKNPDPIRKNPDPIRKNPDPIRKNPDP